MKGMGSRLEKVFGGGMNRVLLILWKREKRK
jgi:hypothetical protein